MVALAAAALTVAACDKTETSPSPTPTPQTLAGTWRAVSAEFVNLANPSEKAAPLSQGTTIVLVLDEAGGFTLTTTDPGQPPDVLLGTWSVSTDVLTLKLTNRSGEVQFDFVMNGDALALEGGHVPYDVNNDDVDEESILTMTMARQ